MSENTQLLVFGLLALLVLALFAGIALLSEKPVETFVFYVFAGAMVLSSAAIVFSKNIVRSATWLLGTLGSAAGLFLLLSANYLAAIQLIVYAGGILILIVFGVMLTAKNPFLGFAARPRELLIAGVVGVVLFAGLVSVMFAGPWPQVPNATPSSEVAPVHAIGTALLTTYLVPFEIVSVLLLAVMIGAAYLARPEKR
ncbi:MAG: NADH-quinone oxidoreductase subunit J [Planctomycetes bacterium]|nr:NADH-quinone oxidoreductase subunit J [Planctomycetota bacterium]